jgi:hypothetical protein
MEGAPKPSASLHDYRLKRLNTFFPLSSQRFFFHPKSKIRNQKSGIPHLSPATRHKPSIAPPEPARLGATEGRVSQIPNPKSQIRNQISLHHIFLNA